MNQHPDHKEEWPDIPAMDAERPHALDAIAQAVSALIPPPLALLRQMMRGVQEGVQARHLALARERDAVQEDGYAAATRLLLSQPGMDGMSEADGRQP